MATNPVINGNKTAGKFTHETLLQCKCNTIQDTSNYPTYSSTVTTCLRYSVINVNSMIEDEDRMIVKL